VIITQIDLPPHTTSGLIQALHILQEVKGIARIDFDREDIVRHKLVQRIVDAYDAFQHPKRSLPADGDETLSSPSDASDESLHT
jgi:phosphate starvation-inducible PhoH-like protein